MRVLWALSAVCVLCSSVCAGEAAQEYLSAARQAMQKGDMTGAMSNYLRVISKDPGCADAHAELGAVYLGMDKPRSAESRFKKALALDPKNVTAKIGMARVHICKDERKEAAALLKEAEQAKAGRPRWGGDRGKQAIQKSMLQSARRELLGSGLTEIKDVTSAIRASRTYNRRGQYSDAIDLLESAIKANPDSAMLYVQLGIAHNGAGNWTRAKEAFEKAIELAEGKDSAVAALAREQLRRMR